MTNESKVSWILASVRSAETIEENELQKMLLEAFLPEKKYKLFLCGEVIEGKEGNLVEMEQGFILISTSMKDYSHGDYGIISVHEFGELLFIPMILTDEQLGS